MTSGPFVSTGPEARTYKRDKDGKFASGTPQQLLDDDSAIRDTFEFHDAKTGLSSKVTDIIHDRVSTEAQIAIFDRDGNQVGRAIRTIKSADRAEVHHDVLELDRGIQGQGFATRFNAHAEESYRGYGIRRITLRANQDVGGYAWARSGYDFADMNGRANVVNRARDRASHDVASRATIETVIARNDFLPIDLAMIGHTPGATTWPGKEIMLGSTWEAVKEL